ncbi:MAG: AAA family ATPase [Candidatus Competibacteraceae bacterium]
MRFLTLDLIALGHFHGKSLQFPEDRSLFLIYGPNEAGKSTCLRALRGLLYGIGERTADDFRHEARKLRVGASLAFAEERLTIVRRKGRKNTLLDPDENPLPEDMLQPLLGGIGQEAYERLFGMTRDELVEGGKALLSGKGGVGESLFAAGLAGADLQGVLETLKQEADNLFKPAASIPTLNSLARRYRELKKQSDNSIVSVKDWEKLETELSGLSSKAEELKAHIDRSLEEQARLERVQQALPLVARLKERHRERTELGVMTLLPEGFAQERESLQERLARARTEAEKARQRITQYESQLAGLSVPDELLAQEATVNELIKESGSVRKARQDLPRVQQQVHEARAEAREILAELRPDLELDAAETLRLPLAQQEHIRRLTEQYGPLMERGRSAVHREQDYTTKHAEAERELATLPPSRDVSELKRTVALLCKKGDLETSYRNAVNDVQTARRQAEEALQRLPLWTGTLESLITLPVPTDATINEFEQHYDDNRRVLEQTRQASTETRDKIGELEGKLERLRLSGEIPLEEDLAAARERRDRGWALVRQAWLGESRDEKTERAFDPLLPLDRAYENSVQEADAVADRIRHEADAVARKQEYLAEKKVQQGRLADLTDQLKRLEAKRQAITEAWRTRWSIVGIGPLSPREMRGWLAINKDLVRQAGEVRTLEDKAQTILHDLEQSRRLLRERLHSANEPAPSAEATLTELLEQAEALVSRQEALQTRRKILEKQVQTAYAELTKARAEREQASQEFRDFKATWAEAVRGINTSLTVSVAAVFLENVQKLFAKLKAAEKDQVRVSGMDRDIRAFEEKLHGFLTQFAPTWLGLPPEQAVDALKEAVARGRTDKATRAGLRSQLDEWRENLVRAQDESRALESRLTALLETTGCANLQELTILENRCEEARRLDADIKALTDQIAVLAGNRSLFDFMTAVENEDPDKAAACLARVSGELGDLQSEYAQVAEQIGACREQQRAMDGRASAAEAAQQAHEMLAELRDGVERYLRLRLAAKVLKAEIERYRERNQGPLLRHAGEIFATVTEGRFLGLEASYEAGDEPVLVGIRGNGDKVEVDGMSDGTQDQLYLALRLASLERYLEENTRLPFVVDDALVNFDDDRAKAALKVIGKLATKTQVLFFTHHRHMVELARSAVADGILHVQEL